MKSRLVWRIKTDTWTYYLVVSREVSAWWPFYYDGRGQYMHQYSISFFIVDSHSRVAISTDRYINANYVKVKLIATSAHFFAI